MTIAEELRALAEQATGDSRDSPWIEDLGKEKG